MELNRATSTAKSEIMNFSPFPSLLLHGNKPLQCVAYAFKAYSV